MSFGDLFITFVMMSIFFFGLSLLFITVISLIMSIINFISKNESCSASFPTGKEEDKYDPFILSFRKTRTEDMIVSRIEEISKSRDIQFVISTYYYKNNKSINGCVYVVTSKILYKLYFIKNSLIYKDIHHFSTFISTRNSKIYDIINLYLSENNNYEKQAYHNEFYTWPHYYLTDNYKEQEENIETFFKSL